VALLNQQGLLNDASFMQVDHLFGYPTGQKGEHISQRMIFMLDYFSDDVAAGKTIYLKSGYRSPKYNQNLRKQGKTAGKTSTHIDGMAIDFYIDGVDGKALWEFIRSKDCCGTGHYGGKTVHLDAGRPRFWQQGTSKVWSGASDFNRYIYLSTDFDRYQAGYPIRLFYTSISDFGFGVKTNISFVADQNNKKSVAKVKLETDQKSKCLMINTRQDARFLYTHIPKKLKPGFYRIQIDFCQIPFEEMPKMRVSNMIEIVAKVTK